MQCWPLPHCAPPLQVQLPLVHPFALVVLHAMQVPPLGPQALAEVGVQVLPEQQPVVQLDELHTQLPFTHAWPAAHTPPEPQWHNPSVPQVSPPCEGQFAQLPPLRPQFAALGGVTHELPLQQPDAQAVELHWQLPLTHCWPVAQGALLPHLHEPPLQLSAASGLHAVHELPVVPHWAAVGGDTQLPAQQPPGQVMESQPWQC